VRNPSPLRYPGGKSCMAGLLEWIRRINFLGGMSMAEPFAGGAGASLKLLYLEETLRIFINDADPSIFGFWWTLTNRPEPFLRMLSGTPVSLDEWRHQRNVYRNKGSISRPRRGFAAFYLNRCNRSGIIVDGGPIGGIMQKGKWKVDARFNKPDLRRRCERVVEYRERISVSGDDGLQFIERMDPASTFYFIDPPYFEKGPTLYLNSLDNGYHEALAAKMRSLAHAAWVLTYDDCPEVRRLYRGWASIRPFSLRYVAAKQRAGRELLITPRWMRLPKWQPSAALKW
jgi:DNA adenine methylase